MRFLLSLAGLILAAGPSFAQGDARAGRAIAQRSCAQCHDVEAGDRDNVRTAPTFQAVADDPGITEPALRAFFDRPHTSLANARLNPKDRTDVLTYILTLKRSRPRG